MNEGDGEQKTPIQIDVYGVKIKAQPKPDEQLDPDSWKEVGRRLNRALMAIVAGVGKLLADTVKSADSIVRGAGDLGKLPAAIEQRITKAHELADAAEAKRAELPPPSHEEAERVIRQILGKKVAEGMTVGVKQEGDNLFIGILAPMESEQVEAIARRALSEAQQIESGSPANHSADQAEDVPRLVFRPDTVSFLNQSQEHHRRVNHLPPYDNPEARRQYDDEMRRLALAEAEKTTRT